jgi:hypothetical protein
LPEIGVAVLQRAQPRILELLLAPQRRQRRAPLFWNVFAARGGGSEVEQRAIGVEDTAANSFETSGRRISGVPG